MRAKGAKFSDSKGKVIGIAPRQLVGPGQFRQQRSSRRLNKIGESGQPCFRPLGMLIVVLWGPERIGVAETLVNSSSRIRTIQSGVPTLLRTANRKRREAES